MEVQEFNRLNQVFSFRRPRSTPNRLVNKNIPGVNVEERDNIVECRDSQSEPTIVRSENPLENDAIAGYFEVQILGTSPEDTINVGLMAKDNTTKQHLGRTNNSFGYYRGDLFLNKRRVQNLQVQVGGITPPQKLKVGDYIGIGINCLKRTFFMIKNGRIISQIINIPTSWNEFYPAVGVSHQNEKVQFTFNPKECKFEYFQFIKQIEKEGNTSYLLSQIRYQTRGSPKLQDLSFGFLISLVPRLYQDPKHAYHLTNILVTQRQKQIHKLPKLCKNPGISNPQLSLNRKSEKMVGQDEDMNEPLKVRHRIMSQILDEKEQVQLSEVKRKNTEMVIDNGRKDSLLSNLSNVSNYNKSEGANGADFYCEEEQKEMVEQLDQNQRFLLNEKVQIIKCLKQKKIELAIELIEKHIPSLFTNDQYLLPYFKAHIFLRMVKQESSVAALQFSRAEKDIFSKFSAVLFPYYNSERLGIEWKPLKFIFTALAYNAKNSNNQKYADMLSNKQFQCFAMYLNSIILQKMGYLGSSRLGYCINNSKKVMEKLNGYKGMSCGVELKL